MATPPQSSSVIAFDILLVTKDGGEVHEVTQNEDQTLSLKQRYLVDTDMGIWTNDGKALVATNRSDPGGILVVESETGESRTISVGSHRLQRVALSPLGRFAAVCSKYDPEENPLNFKVVRLSDGEAVVELPLKNYMTNFPPVRWSTSETYLFRQVSNEIHVFRMEQGTDLRRPFSKIRHENLLGFSVGPEIGGRCNIATCSPVKKDRPAMVRVVDVANPDTILTSTSFFQAQEITLNFNFDGSALLVKASTDVDHSGQSYYGSSVLFLLTVDGKTNMQVITHETAPVHDVEWSPTRNEFVCSYGPMPPRINLFDGRTGTPVVDFGCERRNHLRWNWSGRWILTGGFGNLAGDIDIWDKNKMKVIGEVRAPCTVVCEWTPSGREFISATIRPRLQVDNGIKIYRYNGDLLFQQDIEHLFQAVCRPSLERRVDRGPSPSRRRRTREAAGTKPVQVYKAPGTKGTPRADANHKTATASVIHTVAPRKIPGLDLEDENQDNGSKSKKKKPKKTKADEQKPGSSVNTPTAHDVEERQEVEIGQMKDPKVVDLEKRIRNAKKKLQQVQRLKEKECLSSEERVKLAKEDEFQSKIEELENELKKLGI